DLYFASLAAQLQISASQPSLLRKALQLARDEYDMDEDAFLDFLAPLNQKVQEFASLVDVGPCAKYTNVVASATQELVKLTVEMSADNLRVREEKNQAEQEAAKIRASLSSNRPSGLRSRKNATIAALARLQTLGDVAPDEAPYVASPDQFQSPELS